jgi:hypothetical protein
MTPLFLKKEGLVLQIINLIKTMKRNLILIFFGIIGLVSYSTSHATVTTTTYRSYLEDGTTVVKMVVVDSGNNSVSITTSTVSASNDTAFIFALNTASISGNCITAPNSGHTYWKVPFDNNNTPTTIAGGSGVCFVCWCHTVTGNHDTPHDGDCPWTQSGADWYCSGTCYACRMHESGTIYLQADKLYYNGTLYQ